MKEIYKVYDSSYDDGDERTLQTRYFLTFEDAQDGYQELIGYYLDNRELKISEGKDFVGGEIVEVIHVNMDKLTWKDNQKHAKVTNVKSIEFYNDFEEK